MREVIATIEGLGQEGEGAEPEFLRDDQPARNFPRPDEFLNFDPDDNPDFPDYGEEELYAAYLSGLGLLEFSQLDPTVEQMIFGRNELEEPDSDQAEMDVGLGYSYYWGPVMDHRLGTPTPSSGPGAPQSPLPIAAQQLERVEATARTVIGQRDKAFQNAAAASDRAQAQVASQGARASQLAGAARAARRRGDLVSAAKFESEATLAADRRNVAADEAVKQAKVAAVARGLRDLTRLQLNLLGGMKRAALAANSRAYAKLRAAYKHLGQTAFRIKEERARQKEAWKYSVQLYKARVLETKRQKLLKQADRFDRLGRQNRNATARVQFAAKSAQAREEAMRLASKVEQFKTMQANLLADPKVLNAVARSAQGQQLDLPRTIKQKLLGQGRPFLVKPGKLPGPRKPVFDINAPGQPGSGTVGAPGNAGPAQVEEPSALSISGLASDLAQFFSPAIFSTGARDSGVTSGSAVQGAVSAAVTKAGEASNATVKSSAKGAKDLAFDALKFLGKEGSTALINAGINRIPGNKSQVAGGDTALLNSSLAPSGSTLLIVAMVGVMAVGAVLLLKSKPSTPAPSSGGSSG